jgi:outer membrane protein assembly factor BamD (BamD/ComL family)
MKKRSILTCFFLTILLAIVLAACSGQKASELYDTAKFEELQNNREHAIQLYEQIIVRYPSSDYAVKAKERLDVLKTK